MHEQTCTHKKLSPGEIKLKSKPWITNKIKKMIKFRNKLFACKNDNITMLMLLNYSRSSEIESREKSLNQRNHILLIILRIVPIT